MNIAFPYLPERPAKPREEGLTMMMDKGLSLAEAENFVSSAGSFTDLVKFGFGTAVFAPYLREKIALYKSAGLKPYFGGTLFEAFVIRGMFDAYRKVLDDFGLDTAEVSDGSMKIEHDQKMEYIRILSGQVTVLSEVGSKVAGVEIPNEEWVKQMQTELSAGAWKVIAEARESGTSGIYHSDASANKELITQIIQKVGANKVLWEAPNKPQQVYFIHLLGANVNLGNIATQEVVALEALRLGLRGDTFFSWLPAEMQSLKQK